MSVSHWRTCCCCQPGQEGPTRLWLSAGPAPEKTRSKWQDRVAGACAKRRSCDAQMNNAVTDTNGRQWRDGAQYYNERQHTRARDARCLSSTALPHLWRSHEAQTPRSAASRPSAVTDRRREHERVTAPNHQGSFNITDSASQLQNVSGDYYVSDRTVLSTFPGSVVSRRRVDGADTDSL